MSFEVVVRPAVFPNIRPPQPGLSLPGDAPDKGVATISGTSGGVIDLPWSESVSLSKGHKEQKRTVRKYRMPLTNPDGTLDWSHFIEFEVVVKLSFAPSFDISFAVPKEADNLEFLGEVTRAPLDD